LCKLIVVVVVGVGWALLVLGTIPAHGT